MARILVIPDDSFILKFYFNEWIYNCGVFSVFVAW